MRVSKEPRLQKTFLLLIKEPPFTLQHTTHAIPPYGSATPQKHCKHKWRESARARVGIFGLERTAFVQGVYVGRYRKDSHKARSYLHRHRSYNTYSKYIHTCIHAYTHICMHAYMYACSCSYIHAHIHTGRLVIRRGAICIDMSSWNKSFAAYGISIIPICHHHTPQA